MKNIAYVFLGILTACHQPSDPAIPPSPTPKTIQLGGDIDAQGCKGSAGYTWSLLRAECVRIFEVGQRLNPQPANPAVTLVAYVLFDPARRRAEVFLPQESGSKILPRVGPEITQTWAAGALQLQALNGYELQENGKVIYAGQ